MIERLCNQIHLGLEAGRTKVEHVLSLNTVSVLQSAEAG